MKARNFRVHCAFGNVLKQHTSWAEDEYKRLVAGRVLIAGLEVEEGNLHEGVAEPLLDEEPHLEADGVWAETSKQKNLLQALKSIPRLWRRRGTRMLT